MSTDTEVLVGTVELANDPVEVIGSSAVDACKVPSELEVEGSKQEYSIVGDGLYASMSHDEAPTWLTGLIDKVVDDSLLSSMYDYNSLVQDVRSAIDSINIAKNTFTTAVDVTNIANGIVTSKIDTLNATYEGQFSNIVNMVSTLATDTESMALDITRLNSVYGSVSSDITNIQTTLSNATSAIARDITSLQSSYTDQEQALSTLSTETYAAIEGVRSQFTYNSLVQWGGKFYQSGFGLKATAGGTGTAADPYDSEFWINAEKFKFTNSNQTGQATPFSIDASGATPQITFKGLVDFTNTNAAGTTTLDGGLISTDSIHARSIKVDTLRVNNANISGDLWSTDYSPGRYGWKLWRTGDAEFNTASFRGEIDFADVKLRGMPVSEFINIGSNTVTNKAILTKYKADGATKTANTVIDTFNVRVSNGSVTSRILLTGQLELDLNVYWNGHSVPDTSLISQYEVKWVIYVEYLNDNGVYEPISSTVVFENDRNTRGWKNHLYKTVMAINGHIHVGNLTGNKYIPLRIRVESSIKYMTGYNSSEYYAQCKVKRCARTVRGYFNRI